MSLFIPFKIAFGKSNFKKKKKFGWNCSLCLFRWPWPNFQKLTIALSETVTTVTLSSKLTKKVSFTIDSDQNVGQWWTNRLVAKSSWFVTLSWNVSHTSLAAIRKNFRIMLVYEVPLYTISIWKNPKLSPRLSHRHQSCRQHHPCPFEIKIKLNEKFTICLLSANPRKSSTRDKIQILVFFVLWQCYRCDILKIHQFQSMR